MAALLEESFEKAGRLGLNLLFSPVFGGSLQAATELFERYRDSFDDAGHDPSTRQVGTLIMIYTSRTQEQARQEFAPSVIWYMRTYGKYVAAHVGQDPIEGYENYTLFRDAAKVLEWDQLLATGAVICGEADYVTERLAEIRRARTGRPLNPGGSLAVTSRRSSMELSRCCRSTSVMLSSRSRTVASTFRHRDRTAQSVLWTQSWSNPEWQSQKSSLKKLPPRTWITSHGEISFAGRARWYPPPAPRVLTTSLPLRSARMSLAVYSGLKPSPSAILAMVRGWDPWWRATWSRQRSPYSSCASRCIMEPSENILESRGRKKGLLLRPAEPVSPFRMEGDSPRTSAGTSSRTTQG